MSYSSGKVNLYVDKTGPGEFYTKAKVIRILANNTVPSGIAARSPGTGSLPDIDFADYSAVCRHYGLIE